MSIGKESVIQALNRSFSDNYASDTEIRNEFEERVKTFLIDQRWVKRPLSLSPAICAQFGWKCVNSHLLECVTCSAKLSPGDANIEQYAAYQSCVMKVLQDLKEIHKKHCPWPFAPCPDNFVQMIPVHKGNALNQFSNRLKSLLCLGQNLPCIDDSFLENLKLNDQQITLLFKAADIDTSEVERVNKSAAVLALTGWMSVTESSKSTRALTCKDCQRSVALLSFSTITSDSSESNDSSLANCKSLESENDKKPNNEPPKKRLCLKKEPFNPIYEHRFWCLWIRTMNNTQNVSLLQHSNKSDEEKDLSNQQGWEIFLKCLLQNITNTDKINGSITSPSREELRSVRDLIETWD